MNNIIRALKYQISRDLVLFVAVIIGISFQCLTLLDTGDIAHITGESFAITGLYTSTTPLAVIFMLTVGVCRICAWDMGDKTINYEVLSGHSKTEIYFSRVIAALLWSFVMGTIVTALPILIFTVLNGWGSYSDPLQILMRYFIMCFPILRLVCFMIFMSFIIKKFAISAVMSYIFFEVSMMLKMMLDTFYKPLKFIMASFDLTELSIINCRYGMIDGKDVTLYDASVDPSYAVPLIIVSLGVSALYLLAGFAIFRKRDMD